MGKKRDTVTYELKDANKVLYVGTANNPEQREQQHKNEGKKFGHLRVTSKRMTEAGAMEKEAQRLATYRKNQGRNPKYNKDTDG